MDLSQLSQEFKAVLKYAADKLTGAARRIFMAQTVEAAGRGGQRWAERELGWNRGTIRKGRHELSSGLVCIDAFNARGRKKAEEHLPKLLDDIEDIVSPHSQVDPTFKTTQLYTRLTAKEVRKQLIRQKHYSAEALPSVRTLDTKLNALDYRLKRVAKSQPIKKIAETDAIFTQLYQVNQASKTTLKTLRIAWDAKAQVKIGPFSRGGLSRLSVAGADHDFAPLAVLTPFDIVLPDYDDLFLYFTTSKVTSDFIADTLQLTWPVLQDRFHPTWLVINADNGPENHSHRTQFIKRMVDFAHNNQVNIRLAYYPPYHSKYNPAERPWAILEKHWNGAILDTVDTAVNFAQTMTWRGKPPIVKLVTGVYHTGVKLAKAAMATYEKMIIRLPGLEKWFVDIPACPPLLGGTLG
jgi:transposase